MAMQKFPALFLMLAMISPVAAQNAAEQIRAQGQAGQGQSGQSQQYGNQSGQTQPGQQGQPGQYGNQAGQARQGQAGQVGKTGSQDGVQMDTFIATCLLIGNQEEVALAEMAVDRAESDQVKQFAQMLVDDHQQAIQKLQRHAKQGVSLNAGHQGATTSQSSNAQQLATTQRQGQQGQGQQGNSASVDQILQLQQNAAQECLQMTKAMLEEKQGAEFDKAFAGMQVGMHVGMLAKLNASEQQASGELASIIKESKQTVKDHLDKAKDICKKLEDQNSNRDARQARNQ